MDELDLLLYEAAEQKTRSLPLDAVYTRILAEGKGETPAAESAPEPVKETPAPKAFPRLPIRSLTALAAAALVALITFPAMTETVMVDGEPHTAFAGRVNLGGVTYDLSDATVFARDPQSGDYYRMTELLTTPDVEVLGPPVEVIEETPVPTPAPLPTPVAVREEEPLTVFAVRAAALYAGPGEDYPIVGQMATNDVASRTGITADGWVRLAWEGQVAYGRMDDFTLAATTGVSYPDVRMAAVEDTDVYTLPSTGADSAVCGHLAPGDAVIANRPYGDWIRIKWENGSAYVLRSSLKTAPEGEEKTGWLTVGDERYLLGNPDTGETWGGTAMKPVEMYAETDVTLYAGPGTGHAVIGDLYPGRKITQVGVSGDWAILLRDDKLYYAEARLLKAAPLIDVRYPAVEKTVVSGTAVWPIPREEGMHLGVLSPGEKVRATGSIGEWAVIEYNNGRAYVHQSALANEWEIEETPLPVDVPEIPGMVEDTPAPTPVPPTQTPTPTLSPTPMETPAPELTETPAEASPTPLP